MNQFIVNSFPMEAHTHSCKYVRKKLLALLLLLLSGLYQSVSAQTDSMKVYSLPEVIETAIHNYPSIKARQAENESASQQISVAKTGHMPRLMVQEQVTYATANGMTGSFFPNEGMAIPTSGGTNNVGSSTGTYGQYTSLVLTGPIYAFGKIKSGIETKEAEFQVANMAYQNELFQHKINVSEAYVSLLTMMKLVKIQEVNLQRTQDLQRVIIASTNSGIRPGVDSSYVNAVVAKSKLRLIEMQQQSESAKIRLAELMGLMDEGFEIDTSVLYNRVPQDQSYSKSITKNPLLQYYQSRIRFGEAQSNEIKKSYLPTINYIGAGMARGSGFGNSNSLTNNSQSFGSGVEYKRYNYLVGAYILWNILDYSKVRHTYKSNISLTNRFQYEYEEQQLKLTGMVKNAMLEQRVAKEKVIQSNAQYTSAQSSYKQSFARYTSGLSILPELSQSMDLLNRAEVDVRISQYATWRALLSISASTGDIDLFMNQIK
jgi:outer membrane protein TolC